MAPSRKAPRYAHSDGHTGLCYSSDGKNLVSCGNEGDIRVWHGFEDDDPTEICVGEKAFAVFQAGDKLYVGTDHNNVQAFTFPAPELDRVCIRFTAPVTCISVVQDWLVAGSCDMTVHVFNLSSGEEKVVSDHKGPLLEVAAHPALEYLATSCCDGLVRVYTWSSIFDNTEPVPVHTWNEFITKSNDFETSPVLCRLAWSPNDGTLLAIPHQNKIMLYEKDSWNKFGVLANDGCDFQVVRFSPDGNHLVAGGAKGDVTLFNVQHKTLVYHSSGEGKAKICSLCWNPTESGEIAFCDSEGQLGLLEEVLSSNARVSNGHHLEEDMDIGQIPSDIDEMTRDAPGEEMGDTDDENSISIERIKILSGFVPDGEQGSPRPKEDDDEEDDETDRQTLLSEVQPSRIPPSVQQPPFQPSSTPKHFQYRFMVYNDVGAVRQTNTEEENCIDVEFHDAAEHHAFRIGNAAGHTMASLSKRAVVLACEKDEDKASKLACIVINAWDGSKEWSMEFEDEEVYAVAAGDSFIAAATDKRFLRIFTLGGVQREVISIPGTVVCLNARNNQLVAVCHLASGSAGDQSLCYIQYHIGALYRTRGPLPLPLSPEATLRWIGFSEEGSLLSYDSSSVLRLCQQNSLVWRPVCCMDDLPKGKSDHYFLVGVSESCHLIRCILCKGGFYPPTVPRPLLSQVSWKIPLLDLSSEKSQLEEEFWRKQISVSSIPKINYEEIANKTKEIIAPAVKLFALCCKSENDMRALELCEVLSNPQFLQLAARYANSTGKTSLAEKVVEINQPNLHAESQPRSPSPTYQPAYSSHDDKEDIYSSQSQDMFGEDSYQSTVPENSSNMILAMRQKQVVIKPQPVALGRRNPFKKDTTDKTKTDIITELHNRSQPKTPAPSVNTESQENMKKTVKEKTTSKPQIKFTEWFSQQKESLEEEFPELDKSQLQKVAMKRFKEQQKPVVPSNKHLFVLKNKNDNQDSDKNVENTVMIPSSQEPSMDHIEDSKKRKNIDDSLNEQPNNKKPLTAVNKLQAFSFSKS